MLNKTLTVTILILLIWLSNESLMLKKTNSYLSKQLLFVHQQLNTLKEQNEKTQELVLQQVIGLKENNEKTHELLDQVLQQKLSSKKLKQNKKPSKKKKNKKKAPKKKSTDKKGNSKKGNSKKGNSKKGNSKKNGSKKVATKKNTDKKGGSKKNAPKKVEAKKKASIKEVHATLTQYLLDIDAKIKSKNLSEAATKLSKVKKLLWNIRNNKNVNKEKVLSVLSPVDSLLKKLKTNDSEGVYKTELIKKKIAELKLKGGDNNGK